MGPSERGEGPGDPDLISYQLGYGEHCASFNDAMWRSGTLLSDASFVCPPIWHCVDAQ